MNTIRTNSAKRLLLLILPFIPFIIFLNTDRANVVTVYAEYPTEVISGTSFSITITIEKGNLDGFGRYSHQLPEGFTVECDAQNFEFENNTVKLLWVNLPYSNSFTFTYTVNVPATYSGDFTVAANFGYVLDNERRFAELIPQTITIINDPLALRKYLAQSEMRKTAVRPEDITAYRSIQISHNEAVVSIRVNKKHLRAMSKIEELLPNGYSFYALERENAAFSTQNNVARFMWLEAPAKDIFTVSYKVIANPGYSIKDIYINGAFSYLDNGNTKSIVILERDMNAVQESTGKPQDFQTELSAQYNTGQNVSLAQQNIATSPEPKNISERAAYDLDPNVIQQSIPSQSVGTFAETQKSSSTIATNPQSVAVSIEQNNDIDAEDLETLLRKKQYSSEQVSFFTNINIASQPSSLTQNVAVQSFEEPLPFYTGESTATTHYSTSTQSNAQQTQQAAPLHTEITQDLSKSSVQRVEARTNPVAVNINAIPAPSTYFDNTYAETIDNPEMVSSVTNPSYSKNMENAGLFGNPQEYTDEYVVPRTQPTAPSNISTAASSGEIKSNKPFVPAQTTSSNQTQTIATSQIAQNNEAVSTQQTTTQANTTTSSQKIIVPNTSQAIVQKSTPSTQQSQATQTTSQASQIIAPISISNAETESKTQYTTIAAPKTYASAAPTNNAHTQTYIQATQSVPQNMELTQAELAFQSDLNIPSPIDVQSTTHTTSTKTGSAESLQQTHTSLPSTTSLENNSTQQEIASKQQQTIAYTPQNKELNATRLSNKNNTSQKETQIARIQNQKGNAGVYYRIQISASSRKVNTRNYFKRFKIFENVIVERIAEWYKYSIQKHETYAHARDFRNKIWSETPINDAFVVAYNGNNRITVQEALMITNQQWVK